MSTLRSLVAEIEAFCRDRSMSEAAFSEAVAKDGKFIKRIREGGQITVRKLDEVRAFMAAERAKARRRAQRQPRRKAAA